MPHKNKSRKSIPCSVNFLNELPPPARTGVYLHQGTQRRSYAGTAAPQSKLQTTSAEKPLTTKNKYAAPQLNTALRNQQEMQQLQSLEMLPLTDTVQLTPRSKATIAPKLTQKMNFPPTHAVFKNLVPLNVNDSIIQPRKLHQQQRRRKVSNTAELKINSYEPELRDFVEKLDKLEYIIPEPELHLQHSSDKFNFFQSFKKLYDF